MAFPLGYDRPERVNSIEEHTHREEAIERFYRRQSEQLDFFELDVLFPECPNCGEHARPVYGYSDDPETGYHSDEQGCQSCIGRFA